MAFRRSQMDISWISTFQKEFAWCPICNFVHPKAFDTSHLQHRTLKSIRSIVCGSTHFGQDFFNTDNVDWFDFCLCQALPPGKDASEGHIILSLIFVKSFFFFFIFRQFSFLFALNEVVFRYAYNGEMVKANQQKQLSQWQMSSHCAKLWMYDWHDCISVTATSHG